MSSVFKNAEYYCTSYSLIPLFVCILPWLWFTDTYFTFVTSNNFQSALAVHQSNFQSFLVAHSPYFSALLNTHHFTEVTMSARGNLTFITLNNIRADIFALILKFIYSGSTDVSTPDSAGKKTKFNNSMHSSKSSFKYIIFLVSKTSVIRDRSHISTLQWRK